MKPAPFNLLLETASRDNILILTTSCSTSCIFCSHLQNPEGIEAYYVDTLSREQTETLIEFLDGTRKIIIGESATRICEGEPFLCREIIGILKHVRNRHPQAVIQITTSGIHLDGDVISALESIGSIELNISLNSCSIEGRKQLYRGKEHPLAVEAVKLLKASQLAYSGSIVAMPHLVGWEDIRETVLFLQENGAESIRLFMPGYTRFTKGVLPPSDIRSSLRHFIDELGKLMRIPVIMEPSGIKDTLALVEGIMVGSPAQMSGVMKGDRILRVDGKLVISRVDAYYKAYEAGNPAIELERDGMTVEIPIEKQPDASSGMVFNYDVHPDTILGIKKGISRNRGKTCLILTSELAYDMLSLCISDVQGVKIEAVRNGFFGGNIQCAGLLTLSDIEAHLDRRLPLPQVILLPGIMFDNNGRDLMGRHFMELEEKLGIKAEVI